jgi:hypothetical protein
MVSASAGMASARAKKRGPVNKRRLNIEGFSFRMGAGLVRCEKSIEEWFWVVEVFEMTNWGSCGRA